MATDTRFSWLSIAKELRPFLLPFRKTILLVLVLTSLSITVELLEPIIYKHVTNDLAGLFVHQALDLGEDATPEDVEDLFSATKEPHETGKVSPRTKEQGLNALIFAAVGLLLVNLVSHALMLIAEYKAGVYSVIVEQDFIQHLYERVLRMRLPFLASRSSSALAKQIDQTDELAPAGI